MALSVIWRLRGYGGVSKLVCGRAGFVSRSFSSVSTTGRMSPWLMLPPAKESGDVVYKFFSLAENRVLSFNWSIDDALGEKSCSGFDPDKHFNTLVGSSHGWLGLTSYEHICLINPLTRRHVKLPSQDTPRGFSPCWSAYQMTTSCSPDEDEGECRVLMAYGARELAFCCPCRSPRWTRINYDNYLSFVYSKRQKLFFCARLSTQQLVYLQAWDLRDPLSPKLTLNDVMKLTLNDPNPSLFERDSHRYQKISTKYFLVINEDTDNLFVIRRFVGLGLAHDSRYDEFDFPYKTIAFDVHRYVPESGTMRYMDGGSLDGLSFFIGSNDGFALSVAEFPGLKANSIYFTDVCSPPAWATQKFGGHDLGIFNYEDATISPCYYPCDLPSFKMLAPHPRWFTPNTSTKAN